MNNVKCWNCGTEYENIAAEAAYKRGYEQGYNEGYKDAMDWEYDET